MKTPRRALRGGAGQKKREMDVIATASAWRVPPDVGVLTGLSAGSTWTPPNVWRRIGRRGARGRGRIKRQSRFRARERDRCRLSSVGGAGIVAFRPGRRWHHISSCWLNFFILFSFCEGSKKSEGAPLPTRRRQRARCKKFLRRGNGTFPEDQVRQPSMRGTSDFCFYLSISKNIVKYLPVHNFCGLLYLSECVRENDAIIIHIYLIRITHGK